MKKENTVIVALAVTAAVAAAMWLLLVAPSHTGNQINMTQGVTSQAATHYELHMIILWICIIIGVLVFSAMFTSIALHRKSRGAEPAQFSHSTTAEIVWTIIPILILISMAIPATSALVKMETTSGSEMTVKITGFQWRWRYDYLDDDIRIISSLKADSNAARQLQSGIDPESVDNYLLDVDHPLVLPVGRKVKFLITADDVIHAWWVPDFGWKRDAVPGFINEAWTQVDQPGTYRGQCAELCGKDHGFMPIVVEVLPQDEYDAWVREQKAGMALQSENNQRLWSREELMTQGENVYASQCAGCHQANGQGLAPAFPALAGNAVSTGPLEAHIEVVLNGRKNTAMPAWGEMLSETDIAAALTFTRNAFGNDTGDIIQPATIARIKNAGSGEGI